MPVKCTVPLNVTDEANARIDALGLRAEFERIIEHACGVVEGLRRIDAGLQLPYDLGGEEVVLIEVVKTDPQLADDPTQRDFERWEVDVFTPDVWLQLVTMIVYEASDAG
jgi:hypothetical protein